MSAKAMLLSAKVLLSVIALFTAVSPYVADWNASHIYNTSWPPHAKFHNAQTMAVAVLLGGSALFFIWYERIGRMRSNLPAALVLVSLYWVSQALANLYPGVAWTDPDLLGPGQSLSDFPPQLVLDIIMFAVITLAAILAVRGSRAARQIQT